MAINLEAERKVAHLNDELQGLARNLKVKEQQLQEAGVKIALMDRRMELAKRQTDTLVELEDNLAKAKKQERTYEEAMVQLQNDLDAMEKDNAKLKVAATQSEKQISEAARPETEAVVVETNFETSYLLEQVRALSINFRIPLIMAQLEALRGAVRFLRTENSYLKGHDIADELYGLPPLRAPPPRTPTPPLVRSSASDTETDDEGRRPVTPPTLRSLAVETKLLYRDVIRFSSSKRVVDLSKSHAARVQAEAGVGTVRKWMPRKEMPAYQVLEQRTEAERLSRRRR